jgi:NADPH:quinone reductase-like Zn-dependent oxidoreductase
MLHRTAFRQLARAAMVHPMNVLELTGTGLDSLTFTERASPALGARDLLVRVRAASLNYRDLAIARGEYGGYARPLVLGSDAAGEVVAVGSRVTRFAVGARVCPIDTPDWIAGAPDERTFEKRLGGPADGVFSELLCVSEDAAVATPAHLTDEEAACLAVAGVTAWQALFVLGQLCPGDVVVVQGTGGVSLFALQLARLAGAQVIALSRSATKLARMKDLGATHTVDTSATPAWDSEVLRLTHGRGADIVVDVAGGDALSRSITAARVSGLVVALGFLDGASSTLDLPAAIRRSVTVRTSSGRSRASFEALCRALTSGGVRPVIDRVFEFARAPEAFAHLATGAPFGKIVLRVGAEAR